MNRVIVGFSALLVLAMSSAAMPAQAYPFYGVGGSWGGVTGWGSWYPYSYSTPYGTGYLVPRAAMYDNSSLPFFGYGWGGFY